MAARDIITIGASAGGVEALVKLVEALPVDLPAAVFVVLHVPSYGPSHLPEILSRRGPLPAAHARHGEAIAAGHIYVAPPDHHLRVRDGTVVLTRGPHENRSRPSVDALFRSAAREHGRRVAGVVLTGALIDGALGLQAIVRGGGVAIVQDPAEALFAGMPAAALQAVPGAYSLPVAEIAALLDQLTRDGPPEARQGEQEEMDERDDAEKLALALAMRDIQAQAHNERVDQTTVYTCPECGGTLWQIDEGGLTEFRCHVGHAYGAEVLLGQMTEDLEAVLWRCVRLLVEKATLTRQLADRLRTRGLERQARRVQERAEEDDRQGQLIRDLLLNAPTTQSLTIAQALEEGTAARENPRGPTEPE
jgi:two-component system chemotaxis response regulator CheB